MAEATKGHRILRNTGCQDLLAIGDVTYSGWIRKQTKFHRTFFRYPFIAKLLPWFNKYVVLTKGCAYVYKNENSTAPAEAFLLLDFNRVMRAREIRPDIAAWAFRLEHSQDSSRQRYFACSSEHEMQAWMVEFKKEMYAANLPPTKGRKLIQDLDVIKNRVDDDSSSLDRDELYVYIEDKIQTDGFIQRAVSITSIHNEDSGVSIMPGGTKSLPRPKPPPKPTGVVVPSKSQKGGRACSPKFTPAVSDDPDRHDYEDVNVHNDVSQNMWDDALWTGSKDAGDSCIRNQDEDGVYLIRYTDNGQQAVLVVHIPTKKLCKFKIIEKDVYFLRVDKPFHSGEDLLSYYRRNELPGYSVRLTKSYRHV